MNPWRRLISFTLVAGLALLANGARPWALSVPPYVPAGPSTLPARLTDAEFWRLSSTFSEANGYFLSENLVSNEHTFQYVIPRLKETVKPGGVYMGVAPDQNFTYIIATQPAMAFIVDIRRGNLLQHLFYKAIIEMSADRAEFLSRLFAKPKPQGVPVRATVSELFDAIDREQTSQQLYDQNVKAVRDWLLVRHKFPLSTDDLDQLEAISYAFFWEGPGLRYSSNRGAFAGPPGGFGGTGLINGRGMFMMSLSNFPSYEELQQLTDLDGQSRTYLASEDTFRALKAFEEKNLLVPVVGNFAGSKAIRSVGDYVRRHAGVIETFYVSNVEQYLFQDDLFADFARNIATLPVDDRSVFIRSVSTRSGYTGSNHWSDGRATALDPIRGFVRDFEANRVRTYQDVNARSR